MPRILEGGDLRFAVAATLVFEQDVVAALAVERGIEVDQVYALIREVVAVAQNIEIVAVK